MVAKPDDQSCIVSLVATGTRQSLEWSDDEIMKMLQGGPSAAPSAAPAPKGKPVQPSDDEIEKMLRGN